jgi:hypothetical protein
VPGLTSANSGDAGWTDPLEITAPTNGLTNGYLVPPRTGTAPGFVTVANGSDAEEIYYVCEMTPAAPLDATTGPVMAPTLDDVSIIYMPWGSSRVVAEHEVTHD